MPVLEFHCGFLCSNTVLWQQDANVQIAVPKPQTPNAAGLGSESAALIPFGKIADGLLKKPGKIILLAQDWHTCKADVAQISVGTVMLL